MMVLGPFPAWKHIRLRTVNFTSAISTVQSINRKGGKSTGSTPFLHHLRSVSRFGVEPLPFMPLNAMGGISAPVGTRSEEHTSELQSLLRISYAVFCLKQKNTKYT